MSRRVIYRLVWVPSAVALLAVLLLLPEYKPALSSPAAMVTFTASDGSFAMQRPGNWKPSEMSSSGTAAEVQYAPSEDAFMRVTFDLQRSLLADIDRSVGGAMDSLPGAEGMQPATTRKSPLEKLHEATGAELNDEFTEFKQGETTKARIAGHEGLATEFSYLKGDTFSQAKRTGRYITALTNERCLTVIYHCSTDRRVMDTAMPTFEKMVQSIRIGQGGQP